MKDRKAVKMQTIDLINDVRNFCRSQVDIWRQIPWVATEPVGRDEFDRSLVRACTGGIWLVTAPLATGETHAYVDLLTGELIDTELFHRDHECASIKDLAVLPFAMVLDQLDASDVLHRLKIAADKPFAEHVDPERAYAWRDTLRAKYNLKPVYDATAERLFE